MMPILTNGEPLLLTTLPCGKEAIIRRLEGGRGVLARLAAMGFTPGAFITVLRRSDHGPLLVSLRGARVAIGMGEAAHIFVSFSGKEKTLKKETTAAGNLSIALTGQPNVGKSSVFNLLTGMNQHVGNWTGKTIECKIGSFKYKGSGFSIVDLPGTYSLTASSEEERLARDYIIKEHPDLIVAVVNAATLERSLYLVAELLLLPVPIVIALNMADVAEQEGIQIEHKVLEAALGVPVVPMVASRGVGLVELEEAVLRMANHEIPYQPKRPLILPAHQAVLDRLRGLIGDYVLPYLPRRMGGAQIVGRR